MPFLLSISIKKIRERLRIKKKVNRVLGLWWCRRCAVSIEEVMRRFKGDTDAKDFKKIFSDEMREANKKAGLNEDHLPRKQVLLYYVAESIQATRVIETGVAFGWSSLMILLSLEGREESLLLSTNTVQSTEHKNRLLGQAIPERLRKYWKLILKPDREAVPEALEVLPEIDLCHYDSDKTYTGRMRTYKMLWNALRPGGLLISDDVDDNWGFRDFARSVEVVPIVYRTPARREKYAGILRKPLDA